MNPDSSLTGRFARQGEEAIGRLAQELLALPVVSAALSRAFETRERAMHAQELAMGALNLPSASDLERLTRRVRSVSQRLEAIEDGLDRVEQRLGTDGGAAVERRLEAIESALARLAPPPPAARASGRGTPAAKRSASGRSATPAAGRSRAGTTKPAL